MVDEKEMAIEPEIKEVLDEHKDILEKHTEQIHLLQLDGVETKQRLTNIENNSHETRKDIKEIKTVLYQYQNNMANTLNQIVLTLANANTQITTNKDNNKTNLWIKISGGIITVLGSLFAGSKVEWIKDLFN